MVATKKTKARPQKNLPKSRYQKVQEGLDVWISFYRANPHRFAIDYLGMTWLRPFQQVLICLFFNFTYVMIIASRGMGKSQIVAAAICIRCILYPGTKVIIAAGNRSQSTNVLKKITEELMSRSTNLCNEIDKYNTSPSDAYISFKNSSMVTVVTARDSARSARAHCIVADEFVQIEKSIIDKVLRKFKAAERTPGFYNNPEYKNHPKEPNTEVYISSAYYKYHYSWAKFKSFFKSMIKEENYAVMGFPYQLPVSEGYYPKSQIIEEMQEDDWDSIGWSMEMESLFFGESESAFFSFDIIESVRNLKNALYPIPYYQILKDPKIKYSPKVNGEIRLLSMDVAVSGGRKNDASAICLMQLMPMNNGQYMRNVLYMETMEGGHGQDQAVRLMQLYEDLEADFIVLDTYGRGITVYDQLVQDLTDDGRNIIYPALSCINNDEMAARSKNPYQNKIIYSIKAGQQMNSDMAIGLKDNMKRRKIRFLTHEIEAREILYSNKYFNKLSPEEQVKFEAPYMQVTSFVNETVNLDYDVVGGKIKVKELSGMRKDRYTCVTYANYIASEIERKTIKKNKEDDLGLPVCVTAVSF